MNIYPNKLKNRNFDNADGGRFESEKTIPLLYVGVVFSDSKMPPSATSKTDSSTCLGIESPVEQKQTVGLIQTLLTELHQHTELLFQRFDCERFSEIVALVMGSKGAIFLTGVGKSGIIAKKVATTLSSSGTKAFFLSPQNALHGDLGNVGPGDIVFLFSKSGETSELIELCPALRNKEATLVAVVMNGSSKLAKACGASFVLPELKELCPFDLAPTTSTLAQLVFGDLLAMATMRLKKFSLSDFIQNHPGGRIGRRQLIRVQDLMVSGKKMPICAPNSSLQDVLVELSRKQCGCVCVLDAEERLLGIFTDGDLRRSLQRHGSDALCLPMSDLMTKTPRTVAPTTLAYEALQQMEVDQQRAITVLAVEEGGKCLGVIKMHDILQSGL